MILSNLKNRVELEKLHPLMPRLFEFLEQNDVMNLPLGIHEIVGRDLFINNQAPEVLYTVENAPIEVHRKYIDVQVILSGKETMGWKPIEEVAVWRGEYDEEKDVRFSDERCEHFVTLKAGELVVFYPEDGHAPMIGDAPIRKFIAKLKVQ
ncbi:MAG: YhcH/YjgK/YiaL family protein [Tidjanibacter sp.]|nr:YhcH/YjgK/YiaL family protein [Tidjanibacter sp.]